MFFMGGKRYEEKNFKHVTVYGNGSQYGISRLWGFW